MAKVVVKGESVYECDACSRRIRVPSNKQGIDILQRCIITYGCRGSLRRLVQAKDINSTPAFPPEVQGVQDWFQRRVFYTHIQPVDAQTWTIVHDLANRPIIHAFTYGLVDGEKQLMADDKFTVRTIDLNTTEITFTRPVSGTAQAITLSSQNTTNPAKLAGATTQNQFQITSNTGELTVATKFLGALPWDTSDVTITLEFATPTPTVVTYASVDDTPSIESPWVGVSRIVANGRNYVVRSFNIVTNASNQLPFTNGTIPNGTPFRISKVNDTIVTAGDVLIILGKSPYAAVDRIVDKFIDAGRVDTTFTYDSSTASTNSQQVKPLYPFITVV